MKVSMPAVTCYKGYERQFSTQDRLTVTFPVRVHQIRQRLFALKEVLKINIAADYNLKVTSPDLSKEHVKLSALDLISLAVSDSVTRTFSAAITSRSTNCD